jgi:hypothetical protein
MTLFAAHLLMDVFDYLPDDYLPDDYLPDDYLPDDYLPDDYDYRLPTSTCRRTTHAPLHALD